VFLQRLVVLGLVGEEHKSIVRMTDSCQVRADTGIKVGVTLHSARRSIMFTIRLLVSFVGSMYSTLDLPSRFD
jgi:hypothetical protein